MKNLIIAVVSAMMLSACATTSSQVTEQENLVLMNPEHNCNTPLYDNNKQLIQDNLKDRIVFEKLNGDCGRIYKVTESTYKPQELTWGEQLGIMFLKAIANTRHHRVNTPSGSYSIISNSSTTTITKIK